MKGSWDSSAQPDGRLRAIVIVGAVTFFFILYLYITRRFIDRFSFLGFVYHSPSFGVFTLLFPLAILPSLRLPLRAAHPSQVVRWLLYLMVYVPSILVVPSFTLPLGLPLTLSLLLTLTASLALLGTVERLPPARVPRPDVPPRIFWAGIGVLSLLFYAYVFRVFGVPLRWLPMEDIYKMRTHYEAVISQQGTLAAYLINWQSNILNPLVLAQALLTANVPLALLGLLGQIALYAITGMKSILFSTVMIAALWALTRKQGRRFAAGLMCGTLAFLAAVVAIDMVTQVTSYSSFFLRRIFVVPGLMSGCYLDFFTTHPKLHLSASVFRRWVTYPYDLSPPYLIGREYFGNPATHANANFWAEAYANFGFAGILAYTALLGFILWLFDSFARERNAPLVAILLGLCTFSLANSGLLTNLCTHGLGLALALVYLLPRESGITREGVDRRRPAE